MRRATKTATPSLRRGAPGRHGAAAVEFAVVAPVFFVFVFGMIEFGRMVMVQQILTNAAREGARVAILPGATTSQVQTTATNYLTAGAVSGASVTVNPDPPSSASFGSSVTVTVSVPFKSVSWTPAPFFLGGTGLQAQSIMRTEQSAGSGS